MLDKAREFARKAHKGQTRWDGKTPYIEHPRAVAKRVKQITFGHPEAFKINCQIVAWLHDVVEDTNITIGNLLDEGFSIKVVNAIDAITKREDEQYDEYLIRVAENRMAAVVKVADIQHNLSNLKRGSMRDKYRLAIRFIKLFSEINALSLIPCNDSVDGTLKSLKTITKETIK